MSLRRPLIIAGSIAAILTLSAHARAQEVRVEASSGVDRDALRARIAAELAPFARRGVVTVTLDDATRTIRVAFAPEAGTGAPVERVVLAPVDEGERLRAAVWLSVNLVSDEASDLVGSLRPVEKNAPRPEPPPASAPVPAPELAAPASLPSCVSSFDAAPFTATLFSPLGYPTRPSRTRFAFGLFYDDVASVDGAGIGTVQRFRCDAHGAVVSFLGSAVPGNVSGMHVSGAAHWVGGSGSGLSAAGAAVIHAGPFEGVLASPFTLTLDRVAGVQAGGVNASLGQFDGAELGAVNVARTVRGAQVGLVNVTSGTVSGAQVGLLNVAEDADAAVGLLSVSWARRLRVDAWTSSLTPIELGIMLEGKRVFSGLNFGRLLQDIVRKGYFLVGFEIGVHVFRSDDEGLIWDVLAGTDTSVGIGDGNGVDVVRLGTRVGYRILPRFAPYLYGGAAMVAPSVATQAPDAPVQDFKMRGEFGGGALF